MTKNIFDSKRSVFKITDIGSTSRDLSAYVTEVTGLPGKVGLAVVTAFADGGATFVRTLPEGEFEVSFRWTDDANMVDATLGGLYNSETATAFQYGPRGSATGKVKYSGVCFLDDYEITSRVGDKISARAVFQVNGAVTKGVF